jgi:hypothetical protein
MLKQNTQEVREMIFVNYTMLRLYKEVSRADEMTASPLFIYFCTLLRHLTDLLVAGKGNHVVIATRIRVNRMARHLDDIIGTYAGGRSITYPGICGGPWMGHFVNCFTVDLFFYILRNSRCKSSRSKN